MLEFSKLLAGLSQVLELGGQLLLVAPLVHLVLEVEVFVVNAIGLVGDLDFEAIHDLVLGHDDGELSLVL